jgi:uncharacterized protein (TIGR02145 family)
MKRLYIFFSAISMIATIYGQAPAGFNYQAVARNPQGQLITNTQVTIQIAILKGSIDGTSVYTESFSPTTNNFGLVNLNIGNGTVMSGTFADIDWGADTYFIKVWLNSTEMGTTQLLSVPYALHAKTAENLAGGITETDPIFTAWDKSTGITIPESQITDLQSYLLAETDPVFSASLAKNITAIDTTYWNNKLDSFTEIDPVYAAWDKSTGILITESQITDLHHFTNADETDPVFSQSVAIGIKATDTIYWSSKLSSFTETDPLFEAWNKSTGIDITSSQIRDFQTSVTNNAAVLANTAKNTYPTVDSVKLAGIQIGAEVNVNADWNATSGDAQILNQPVLAAVATSGSFNDLLNKPVGNTIGDLQYWNGTSWEILPPGTEGQVLVINSSKVPSWKNVSAPFLVAPIAITETATDVLSFSTTVNGTVNANNLSTDVVFEWGKTTTYEIGSDIADESPVTGNSDVAVSFNLPSDMASLEPGTTYHYRIKAKNAVNITYGNDSTFTTLDTIPQYLTTAEIKEIKVNTALSGGSIIDDGGSTVIARGVCWNTSTNPTIVNSFSFDSSGTGEFISSIAGLTEGTTYFVRAYATNSVGTAYGNELSFTTIATVGDIDGNVYNSITLGTQVWMAENLKTTKYQNGDLIPNVTDNTTWTNLTTGAYCDYDNTPDISLTYGSLYNWYAVSDSRNVCPSNWHVPSDEEWTVLTNYLGGDSVAGGKLKEGGLLHWNSPNTDATNETGFTALPGGMRYYTGPFGNIGGNGLWWSSSEINTDYAWGRNMAKGYSGVYVGGNDIKPSGFSVRCLQDSEPEIIKPTLNTAIASLITSTTATSGGNISDDGGSSVTFRGVCWNTSGGPTITDAKTDNGTGVGSFTSSLSGLVSGTTYHIRAYATNSAGTAYGNELVFTSATGLLIGQSYDGGIIFYMDGDGKNGLVCAPNDQGFYPWGCEGTRIGGTSYAFGTGAQNTDTIISKCAGENAAKICKDLVLNGYDDWYLPSLEELVLIYNSLYLNGIGNFNNTFYWSSSEFPDEANTTHARGYSFNPYQDNSWKSYALRVRAIRAFSISTSLPIITTMIVDSITQFSATSGGNITDDGGEGVTVRGVCWSTTGNPTIADTKTEDGTGVGSFTSSVSGLIAGTSYYLRAYATNSVGTTYGNEISFATLNANQIVDSEGNVYNSVTIGTQVWMAENLKTTKYQNGDLIPNVTDNTTWSNLTTGAYCDYNNSQSNSSTYGRLYNWYAINDSQNVCPVGWHVPTDTEWTVLTDFLGGANVAGGILKNTTGWYSGGNGTNTSGFSALPGGERGGTGSFYNIESFGNWWSTTTSTTGFAWNRALGYSIVNVPRDAPGKGNGMSVRCLKD